MVDFALSSVTRSIGVSRYTCLSSLATFDCQCHVRLIARRSGNVRVITQPWTSLLLDVHDTAHASCVRCVITFPLLQAISHGTGSQTWPAKKESEMRF